ncbi:hypothetical protein LTR53_003335 [Teratosphaeriaceae sp. CCFEE 6253]|nr:hypothetical protein LTR53_003335 [Teratosphaeriaceae sp. CCFEE 6253]
MADAASSNNSPPEPVAVTAPSAPAPPTNTAPTANAATALAESHARIAATVSLLQALDIITHEDRDAIQQNLDAAHGVPGFVLTAAEDTAVRTAVRALRRAPGVPRITLRTQRVSTTGPPRLPVAGQASRRQPVGPAPADLEAARAAAAERDLRHEQDRRRRRYLAEVEDRRAEELWATDAERRQRAEDAEDAAEILELGGMVRVQMLGGEVELCRELGYLVHRDGSVMLRLRPGRRADVLVRAD